MKNEWELFLTTLYKIWLNMNKKTISCTLYTAVNTLNLNQIGNELYFKGADKYVEMVHINVLDQIKELDIYKNNFKTFRIERKTIYKSSIKNPISVEEVLIIDLKTGIERINL